MVRRVESNRDLSAFIRFPAKLYRNDPRWTPPVWLEERSAYDGERNPVFAGGEKALFLSHRDGAVAGRLLVYIDPAFNRYYEALTAFFGAFEAVNDGAVAQELIAAAANWARELGMDRLRGPINPVVENWGLLIEGFDDPAVFLTPYNPRYYPELLERAGLAKVKDLLAYVADTTAGYEIPPRFHSFAHRFLLRRPSFSVRRIDLTRLQSEAETIWRLSNASLADNWGYVPVGREIVQDMVKKLSPILDADAVWFVCDGGRPVGFALGWPDLNVILRRIRGRLIPFGFLSLLAQRRRLHRYRLFGLGVLPEYHGHGLDALLYVKLYEALNPRGIRLEANYVLEDNLKIRNALEKMAMTQIKRYRVFERGL